MRETSKTLQRVGVGLLSAATLSVGLTAFAAPAFASGEANVKTVTLSPSSSTALSTQAVFNDYTNTGDNAGCQDYTVTAKDAQGHALGSGIQVNVLLKPTSDSTTNKVDSIFCSGSYTVISPTNNNGYADGNPGGTDQATFTTDSNGQVFFGASEFSLGTATKPSDEPTGSVGVTAYVDQSAPINNVLDTGEPSATGTVNIVSSPDASTSGQDEITDKLTVDPATSTVTEGTTSEDFTVTTSHGSSLVAGAEVYYQVVSSQGNAIGSPVGTDCGDTNNGGSGDGTITCTVPIPATVTGQSGPYTVTFYTPHESCDAGGGTTGGVVTACDASTTATISSAAPAPANSIVLLTCGDQNTDRFASYYCLDAASARSETLTATVLAPKTAAASTATVPVPGVVVTFTVDYDAYGSGSTFSPETCTTGTDGTCTTTLNRASDDSTATAGTYGYNEDYASIVEVDTNDSSTTNTAYSNDSTSQNGLILGQDELTEVDWGYYSEVPYNSPATNIAAKKASDTGVAGQSKLVEFDVANQYGNPSTATCASDEDSAVYLIQNDEDCSGPAVDYGSNAGGLPSTTVPVTLTITGGTFSDGTTQKVVNAVNGTVQTSISSAAAGTATVTANLDPATTDCTVPPGSDTTTADYDNDYDQYDVYGSTGAGNCSAQEAVAFASGSDTLNVSATNGTVGSTKNVSATVRNPDGTPASGVTVSFTVTGANSATGTAATNASGVANFAYTPSHTGTDTVSAVASAPGGPSNSATITIGKRAQHPTIHLTSRNGHVTVHVTSHPAVRGATVKYYVKRHGSFHRIGSTGTTSSTGHAHKSFREPVGHHRTFKARVGSTSTTKAGTSAPKSIKVRG